MRWHSPQQIRRNDSSKAFPALAEIGRGPAVMRSTNLHCPVAVGSSVFAWAGLFSLVRTNFLPSGQPRREILSSRRSRPKVQISAVPNDHRHRARQTWPSSCSKPSRSGVGPNASSASSATTAPSSRARISRSGRLEPGKPTQNAFAESFNGRFRDECLNLHWFESLPDARRRTAAWRQHYNHARPHSGLGNLNPHQFHQLASLGSSQLKRKTPRVLQFDWS